MVQMWKVEKFLIYNNSFVPKNLGIYILIKVYNNADLLEIGLKYHLLLQIIWGFVFPLFDRSFTWFKTEVAPTDCEQMVV